MRRADGSTAPSSAGPVSSSDHAAAMKLKAKFTLIVSVFVVTLLALIAFFTFSHYKKSIKETIAKQQFLMLSILADDIDSKILASQQYLIALAQTAPPDIMQNHEKAQAFLDIRQSLHLMFDNHLFLYTPSGKIFVESPYTPGRRGLDYSFRDYISNTIKTNQPYISDPYVSTQPHKHQVIMFTVPLFDGKGKITGILAGSIDLMGVNFLGSISTVRIGKTGYLYLAATDRTLIMHPDKQRILTKQAPGLNRLFDKAIEGFQGTDETITSHGIKMVSSCIRMKVKNWILLVNYPQSEAYRPIQQARHYFLLATITGIIAVFFIISFIIRYLIEPIELFTRHVENLPQKTGDDRLLNIKTKDEIGTLSVAFNKMETERRRVEEQMKAANQLFENIIEFLPDATFIIDKDKHIIAWNRAMEEMTGLPKKDIVGNLYDSLGGYFYGKPRGGLLDLVFTYDKEIASKYLNLKKKRDVLYAEAFAPALYKGKGAYIWVTASPLFDTSGNMKGAIESIRDISDRKNFEDALRASEEKYRTLFEESKDAVYISTPEGKYVNINQAGVELFGYSSKEELLAIDIANDLYFNPEDRKIFENMLYQNGFVKDYQILMKRKDGKKLTILSTSSIVRDELGAVKAYRGIMHDVTEHKNLEQQLLQAQKMQAVGQLAGGIAHDFNNLLTAIIGYSDLELTKLPEDTVTAKNIKIIRDAGEKAASLVRQILAFSRKQVLEMSILNLNMIVEDMGKLLTRTIGENIALELNIKTQVKNIMADPGQIGQILLNLAINARDAMPSGGRLSIGTSDVCLDEDFIKTRQGVAAGNYVLLSVTDTGYGMGREMQDRIFEPFFTTKEPGKGTGLGLSTVYGIVQQHNGCIWLYSEEGKGSTFRIYLPAVKGETKEAEHTASIIASGTETILVVDDEPDIRKFIFDMLQPLGYKVFEASCADEALRISDEIQDIIDLLLTDLTMPGMNGLELRELFLKKSPAIKVIVMSGYGDEAVTGKNITKEDIIFMQKPFTFVKLENKLRDVLDGK